MYFIEAQLIYSVVLVPGVQQNDLVIHIHFYLRSFPFWFIGGLDLVSCAIR